MTMINVVLIQLYIYKFTAHGQKVSVSSSSNGSARAIKLSVYANTAPIQDSNSTTAVVRCDGLNAEASLADITEKENNV